MPATSALAKSRTSDGPNNSGNQMESTQDYHMKNFNPQKYLMHITGVGDPGIKFTYRCLHNIFQNDIVKGDTLLDVGSGPSLHTCISASRKIKDITLSDLCQQNRAEVLKWKDQHPGAHDWTPNLKYIADLENENNHYKVEVCLRNVIRGVIPIDILDEAVCQTVGRLFDVLTCSRVLESAALNAEDYYKCLKNLHGLLNPNGYLILISPLLGHFYLAGDVKTPIFPVSREILKKAMPETGFDIIQWQISTDEPHEPIGDAKTFSVLVAQKQ